MATEIGNCLLLFFSTLVITFLLLRFLRISAPPSPLLFSICLFFGLPLYTIGPVWFGTQDIKTGLVSASPLSWWISSLSGTCTCIGFLLRAVYHIRKRLARKWTGFGESQGSS